MLIFIGVIFCLLYLYSMMEDVVTKKASNKMSGLKKKYDDTIKDYNVLQLAKKLKEKKRG
ncbi:hypothetical protein ACQJ2V_04345 [Klebsiella variicola subsp. variicola]|uniref:hypothetical protein n=1 Tax=Klebsiella variicola TaxID=244366 RepID=UPI003D04ADAC